MPVVRELINRVSFNVKPGTVKNAENAFSKMKSSGLRAATAIKTGFKVAIGGITAASAAGVIALKDLETQTANTNFYSRSKEDAEKILSLVNKIADRSDVISKREAARAAASLSSITANFDIVEKLAPFIEKISIAKLDLDFDDVAQKLREVIKGGDLQALQELVPGIKNELEILSKTTFSKPFGDITEQQRAELTLQTLIKSQGRLNELAEKNKDTLSYTSQQLEETGSDFATRFGKETAPAIKDLLKEINTTIDLISQSESFWNTVKSTVEGISSFLKATRLLFGGGEEGEGEKRLLEARSEAGIGNEVGDFRGNVASQFKEGGTFEDGLLTPIAKIILGPIVEMLKGSQNVEVSGETRIVIEGKDLPQGMDVKRVEQIANQVVNDKVITPIRNVRARNGAIVPNSPGGGL